MCKLGVGTVNKAIPREKKGIAIKGENPQLSQFCHNVNKCGLPYNDTWFPAVNH